MKKDSPTKLSWMTEEIENQMRMRSKIAAAEDFDSLFSLTDNGYFAIALHQILVNRHNKNPDSLNPIQFNLFLCMHLENAGQADGVLAFLQEWFPQHKEQVVISLKEIGAAKSSKLIEQVNALLPSNGEWFYKSSNKKSEKLLHKLDYEFSSYPDRMMCDLYREYAEKHRRLLVF